MRSLRLGAALAILTSTVAAAPAAAQSLRFATTQPGNVVVIGNTLGLAKASGVNGPGALGSIGTFLSLDPASVDDTPPSTGDPWANGTTSDWTENGSATSLVLPDAASEVLYAELYWGGSYRYGNDDVTSFVDMPVTLAFGAEKLSVQPAADTAETLDYVPINLNADARFYARSADVTEFVKAHASGVYSVAKVPGTQASNSDYLNAAGWALAVVYRRDGDPLRNMSVYGGANGRMVDIATVADYPAYFCAPTAGVVRGTVGFAALEGDVDQDGDALLFGADEPSLSPLSGPNNPADNFFASQLNRADGLVDTLGTYGTLNHDAAAGTAVAGARQGWDVTNVALSSERGQLATSQQDLLLRAATSGDLYLPVVGAVAVDVHGPRFRYESSMAAASPTFPTPGGFVTLSLQLVNEGSAPAEDVQLTLEPPADALVVAFSTDGHPGDVGGGTVKETTLGSGVPMGTLGVGETRTVTIDLVLDEATMGPTLLQPVWSYRYTSCAIDGPQSELFRPRAAQINVSEDMLAATTGSGSHGGQGGAEPTEIRYDAVGGWSCASAPLTGDAAWMRWPLLALVARLLRERKGQRRQRHHERDREQRDRRA